MEVWQGAIATKTNAVQGCTRYDVNIADVAQLGFERPNVNNIRSAKNATQEVWQGAIATKTNAVQGCTRYDVNIADVAQLVEQLIRNQ